MERSGIRGKIAALCDHCVPSTKSVPDSAVLDPGCSLNHQNVLSSLNFSLVTDSKEGTSVLQVELEHCYGLSGSFNARKAKVVSIVPFERDNDA
jgi:hypothetical protein